MECVRSAGKATVSGDAKGSVFKEYVAQGSEATSPNDGQDFATDGTKNRGENGLPEETGRKDAEAESREEADDLVMYNSCKSGCSERKRASPGSLALSAQAAA